LGLTAALLTVALGLDSGLVLLDGRELPGRPVEIKEGAVRLERGEPVLLEELSAIVFGAGKPGEAAPASFDAGPLLVFRDGEEAPARVLQARGAAATVQLGQTALEVPTEALRAFRLREAAQGDDIFEADLKGSPPARDVVYVRRSSGLLRVEGVFRALDEETLTLEYEGQERRVRRQLVLGVIFAPVATASAEVGFPGVIELRGGGQLPGFPVAIAAEGDSPAVRFRFRGAATGSSEAVPTEAIERLRLSSDRVLFLSAARPASVEETPLLGKRPAFPWRQDLAASGGPIKMAGKQYRRGLGVHSRSALEYALGARYRSFAATIGLDDTATAEAGVTFRVLADGKELYKKDMAHGSRPELVVLPVADVERLRLEVDYGPDGLDLGDHANWAEARATK
jgi:hypothetical protein